jgi:RNA polymerase sigma factor (sigma-70 family)
MMDYEFFQFFFNTAIRRITTPSRAGRRREKRFSELSINPDELIDWDWENRDPFAIAVQREMTEIIANEINELPDQLRKACKMYYIEYKTRAEIAESLGISDSAVSMKLHRAVVSLRQTLGKRNLL